jgi:hypothetical protein
MNKDEKSDLPQWKILLESQTVKFEVVESIYLKNE